MNKRKEVFGFRKSKVAKTLCGAVLGAALIAVADQQALADEVTETNSTANVAVTTTGNPATNLPEAQGEATEAASQSQAKVQPQLPQKMRKSKLKSRVTTLNKLKK